jgi:small subunit ribosomal protein S13
MAAPKKQGKLAAKEQPKEKPKRVPESDMHEESLIRVYGYDIRGSRPIYTGLTYIKGVSWSVANAACVKLGLERGRRLNTFSKEEIKKIEDFLKQLDVPKYMKNRQSDPETGAAGHFLSTDLDRKKDFDIRRLKKIRTYKGIRHGLRLPVRGQRTRSHFRKTGVAVGVKRKSK